jgi:CheY-like chemotaxis protein
VSADLNGLRVLIIEDELFAAMHLESVLEQLGCVSCGSAPTVTRALRALGRQEPDVAVLDVNLRGERVTPVAEVLQKQGVPVVLVTGYGSDQLPERLQDVPCLPKPVDGAQLASAISDLLARPERD